MESRELLDSLVEYCQNHPEERFWQALRNWSKWSFIYASNKMCLDCLDTFYWRS